MLRYTANHIVGLSKQYKAGQWFKLSISGEVIAKHILVYMALRYYKGQYKMSRPNVWGQYKMSNNQSIKWHLDDFTRGQIIGKIARLKCDRCCCGIWNYSHHHFTSLKRIYNNRNCCLTVQHCLSMSNHASGWPVYYLTGL